MLKFWLYIILLILFIVLGLTIGSANDSIVTFDFLFVKTELSLAMVMVIGLIVGIIVGIYLSLIVIMRMWAKTRVTKAELKRFKKVADKAASSNAAATEAK